jgi:hypothetical protein
LEVEMINTRRITLATLVAVALAVGVAAQPQGDPQKARPRTTTPMTVEQDKKVQTPLTSSDGVSTQASSPDDGSEEANVVTPYYRNFFNNYRLGPEDIISV